MNNYTFENVSFELFHVKQFFLILHNEQDLFEPLDLEAFEKVHFELIDNESGKKILFLILGLCPRYIVRTD